ncbi:MAG: response regulator transcription factor [Nitriliruptorales bacterium]|nr:response regulator transcription factor [Nitriliruptorales bacterium]
MRIMMVDDDPAILSLVASVFEADGEHYLEAFADPVEAWVRLTDLTRPTPDIVILDVVMPGLNGLDLLQDLRSHAYRFDVPVVLLTARDSVDDEVTGWYAGCDAYVRKPFDPMELMEAVELVADAGPDLRVARRRQRLQQLLGHSLFQ